MPVKHWFHFAVAIAFSFAYACASNTEANTSAADASSGDGATDAAIADARTDGLAIDGGTDSGSNPGKVTCGSTECQVPSQACCDHSWFDGGTTCISSHDNCEATESLCDEAADCPTSGICCWIFGIPYFASECGDVAGTTCGSDPNQGGQRCKTSAECGAGGNCEVFACPDAQHTVQACSKPPFCN